MNRAVSYSLCHSILRENNSSDYQIDYILVKNENSVAQYQAYATSKNDVENMICIKFTDENSFEIHNVASWDFNIEEYFLNELENNYEIDYMPLESHYNFWCAIDEWRDEIEHQDKNVGYTIIAEMKCGEKAIVLAERKTDIAPYVTWTIRVDRKRGFDQGHYFSDFKSAYQDFEKRSHNMMDNELSFIKNKCRPKKRELSR